MFATSDNDKYGRSFEEQLADEIALSRDLRSYNHLWVAIVRSKVVASASTLKELEERINALEIGSDCSIVAVENTDGAASYLSLCYA